MKETAGAWCLMLVGKQIEPRVEGSNKSTYSDNSGFVKVACCAGDDAAKEETTDNAARFHDWGAKPLHEENHDEDRESKTDVLG